MTRAILAFLLVVAATAAAEAYPAPYACSHNNYYVATNGFDGGGCGNAPGASACASIQGANNNIALQGGDCVNVAAGTYNTGTIILNKGGSSNQATGYVTYVGAANHGSKINITGGYLAMAIESSYIILDGFEFFGHPGSPTDAMIVNTANGISHLPSTAHHLMIINNIVHDADGAGIGAVWNDYYIFAGNTVYNTAQCTPYGESGISILWPTAITGFTPTLPWDTQYYHIQILDNTVYNTGYRSSCPTTITGQTPSSLTEEGDGIIADNWQLQNYDASNGPSQPGNVPNPGPYPYHGLIAGNVVYNSDGRGININSGQNMDVYNNSTYHNGTNLHSGSWCEILLGGSNVHIANNVAIASTAAPENGTTLCWISAYGFSEAGTSVTYNDFYNGTGGSGVTVQGTQNDGANMASITAFSSHNLLAVNPLLTNVPTDFHPLAGSPVLGAGSAFPTTPILPEPANVTIDGFTMAANPANIGAFNLTGQNNTVAGPVSIAAGGGAAPPYIADAGFNGGTAAVGTWTTDTSLVTTTTPAPQAVYQGQRYGPSFFYVVSGLTVGKNYTAILHFTEDFDTAASQRQENVTINGTQVLSGLDIFAAAGAQHKAIARSFVTAADPTGSIKITFTAVAGLADANAKVDGIQVLAPPTAANQTASTPYATPVSIDLSVGSTGSPKSAAVSGMPVGGTVSVSGLIATFTPTGGFSGNASFQFTLSGDGGTSNTATANSTVGQPVIGGGPQPGHVSPPYNCLRSFYVATTGSDSNSCVPTASCCSSSAPCASIQGAHNNVSLQAGDCVNVAAGIYNTSATINLMKGGNANKATGYVTYIGAPNRGSIINFNAPITNGVTLTGSYMIFDGFEFAGNSVVTGRAISAGPFQTLSGQVHHIQVLNSSIHDFGGSGIAVQGGDYYTFAGNLIYNTAWHSGTGDHGLSIFEPAAIPGFASGCALDAQVYHIQVLQNVSHNNGCLRGDSNCLHGQGDGFGFNDFYGAQWKTGANAATWPGAYPSSSLIAGNLAYANGGRGLELAPNTNGAYLFNNTSYGNGADPSGPHDEFVLVGSNNNIYDNLFWDTAGGNAINFNNTGTASPDTGNVFAYNLTFNGTPGQQSVSVTNTSNNAGYLAQITGAPANNQLGVAPAITSTAVPDFHPLAGSPLLGTGGGSIGPGYMLLTVDGNAFPNPTNIGGYNISTAISSLPPCTTSVECFQYIPGWWFIPDKLFTSNGSTSPPGANVIRCVPAGMRSKATIAQLATRVYNPDASGHIQFAIYTNGQNQRPATYVATSASASVSSAGAVVMALSANIQGGPGGTGFTDTFWICANTDSNTATFGSTNALGGIGPAVLGSATSGNVLQQSGSGAVLTSLRCSGGACFGGSSAFGTFPASLANTTWTEETGNKMPAVAFQFTSVP